MPELFHPQGSFKFPKRKFGSTKRLLRATSCEDYPEDYPYDKANDSWVAQLIIVMPATNAASERSFSVLRRIKSYLRSTMTQQRLNHLMILNINKEALDEMDLKSIANESVQGNEHRLSVLGNFK